MIDCIMSISSDTLVLVDSSSKVRTSLETSLCFRWLIVKLYRVLPQKPIMVNNDESANQINRILFHFLPVYYYSPNVIQRGM